MLQHVLPPSLIELLIRLLQLLHDVPRTLLDLSEPILDLLHLLCTSVQPTYAVSFLPDSLPHGPIGQEVAPLSMLLPVVPFSEVGSTVRPNVSALSMLPIVLVLPVVHTPI